MTEEQLSSLIFEVNDLCHRKLDIKYETEALTRNGLKFSVEAKYSDEWTPPEEMPRIRGFYAMIQVVAHSPSLTVFDDNQWVEHGPWEELAPKVLQEIHLELQEQYKEKLAREIQEADAALLAKVAAHEKLVQDATEALIKVN